MRQFGLIGKTLKHSFSASYFANKFLALNIEDAYYDLYELDNMEDFRKTITDYDFGGLNVTIPYKRDVIPFLDSLEPAAEEIGAVNTIAFTATGLIGYNTDWIGFADSCKQFIGRKKVENALVLGSGGASLAICFALKTMGINYRVVSRTKGHLRYEDLEKHHIRTHRLIVNCTPLGTFPDVNSCPPIPYEFLTRKHLLFDLVYNPEKTLFLKQGEQASCSIMNGYDMLVRQAEASWSIWNTL